MLAAIEKLQSHKLQEKTKFEKSYMTRMWSEKTASTTLQKLFFHIIYVQLQTFNFQFFNIIFQCFNSQFGLLLLVDCCSYFWIENKKFLKFAFTISTWQLIVRHSETESCQQLANQFANGFAFLLFSIKCEDELKLNGRRGFKLLKIFWM